MNNVAIIIGYRDRGTDPLRSANLNRTLEHWASFGAELSIVNDGGTGQDQWNRHRAYNRGAAQTHADILCYVESDMLISFTQMDTAIEWATLKPGLVVPFTERHELSPQDSDRVRNYQADYLSVVGQVIKPKPRRTGAINVLSRATLDLVGGYDETFSGSWWDDRAMHRAFDICAGPTRWVNGPSVHLYHLPGYQGAHLSDEDRAATRANRRRFGQYQRATTPEQMRELTRGRAANV